MSVEHNEPLVLKLAKLSQWKPWFYVTSYVFGAADSQHAPDCFVL